MTQQQQHNNTKLRSSSNKQRRYCCLIIGGGISGLCAAKGLRRQCPPEVAEIILVEPKDYMEAVWAAYRSPFDAATAEASLFDLEPFCHDNGITHHQTLVTQLTDTTAVLATGEEIVFDVCVVATGADYKWQACGRGILADGSREARLNVLRQEGERLLQAESVCIVGGGIVGAELAGDLAYHRRCNLAEDEGDDDDDGKKEKKNIQVTLVQSATQLCTEMGIGAGTMIQQKLKKLGVRVVLNDRLQTKIVHGNKKHLLESTGEEIVADQVVMAVGNSAVNQFVANKSWLDEKGWLQTDEYFRVKGAGGKVFALGDCSDLLSNAASKIMANIGVLGRNLKATLDDVGEEKKEILLRKHVTPPDITIATVGPYDGVASVGASFHTQYVLPRLKNWTMFFFRVRMDLGLK